MRKHPPNLTHNLFQMKQLPLCVFSVNSRKVADIITSKIWDVKY